LSAKTSIRSVFLKKITDVFEELGTFCGFIFFLPNFSLHYGEKLKMALGVWHKEGHCTAMTCLIAMNSQVVYADRPAFTAQQEKRKEIKKKRNQKKNNFFKKKLPIV